MGLWFCEFLTSPPDGDERRASYHGHIISGERWDCPWQGIEMVVQPAA